MPAATVEYIERSDGGRIDRVSDGALPFEVFEAATNVALAELAIGGYVDRLPAAYRVRYAVAEGWGGGVLSVDGGDFD